MTPPDYGPTRDAAIAWLMGRINYERAAVIPYGEQTLKLDRVHELLHRLGDPHRRLRIVHLAGTKGKGSTGAMIAGALRAGGLRTGVNSSPHLDRLEERFSIDGQPCTAEELVALTDAVRPHAEAMDDDPAGGPTFFDLTTAMALKHFAQRECDAVVLEVGLGGRLDSTNVVTPAVSVITSISLDHTKLLGATRGLIAAEKAGILKPGVPAVSGVADPEAGDVIERIATERGCPFIRRGRGFDLTPSASPRCETWEIYRFIRTKADGSTETIDGVVPALPGQAQAENAAVALATLGVLADAGWEIPLDARLEGLATGKLPARMERFEGEPLIVIDGAHNDASAEALAEAIGTLCPETPRERRVLVVAVSDDKDTAAILKPLARRFDAVVATRFLDNPRAVHPATLAEIAGRFWPKERVKTAPTPDAALAEAKRIAPPGGAIVFAGSLLFAAEVRRLVVAELSQHGLEPPWEGEAPAEP